MKKIDLNLLALIVFIVGVVFVIVKGGFLSGIGDKFAYIQYNKEEKNKENASGSDGNKENASLKEEEKIMDARYLKLPIENNVRDKDTYYDYSNQKMAWWFKRNDEHLPSGCDDTLELSDYGAYYLDENTEDKVVYLTFDCGYENGYTEKILNVLYEQEVPACFFVTKTYIRDNPELTKRMKEENHQVGNHTITHPSMPTKSYEEIINEVNGCAEYMKEVTGYGMDPYLRPPMGEYSERTLMITRDLGYKTIFWSMAYVDFYVDDQPGKDYVINHFEKYHHSGAIILMHNVSSSNAEALETVIVNLKAKGYRFASLNELK